MGVQAPVFRSSYPTLPAAVLFAASFAVPGCYTGIPNRPTFDDHGDTEGDTDGGGIEACEHAGPNVGHAPLRRLTRDQYDRTVRDLLGLAENHSAAFPPDEKIGAFFANAVAPVGELTVETYMDAAEAIAAAVDLDAIVPCDPAAAACPDALVGSLGRRAFRRPLSAAEAASYRTVFDVGATQSGFDGGARLLVEAFLQSPHFLYIVELGLPDPDGGQVVPLTSHELATRMGYFLWGSMPDDELLDLADAGALDDPEVRLEQLERMLADPRGAAAIGDFHLQWLNVEGIEGTEKDTEMFPIFDAEHQAAMRAEVTAFANHVIRHGDGRLETLLTAPYTVIEAPMFDIYGMNEPPDWSPGDRVQLDPDERAGLLSQPAFLASHAHADQSSPVHRGVVVRQNILCQPLPPPPPNADNVPPEVDPDATTRERFEQHTSDPACAGCHTLIDGIGFGFEHYDAIGQWRATENGSPVDASGTLAQVDGETVEYNGTVELSRLLAESEEVRTCVSRQWFRFALGRGDTADDTCSIEMARSVFAEADHDVRALLRAIVQTEAFAYRRSDPQEMTDTGDAAR